MDNSWRHLVKLIYLSAICFVVMLVVKHYSADIQTAEHRMEMIIKDSTTVEISPGVSITFYKVNKDEKDSTTNITASNDTIK